jgi:hypothetical protein
LVQLDATPDAIINGKEWEFKALRGSSHSTVNAILGKAQKKSDYVVLDNSQGSGLSDEEAMAQVLDSFTHKHRHVKEVIFIGKSGKLSYLKK